MPDGEAGLGEQLLGSGIGARPPAPVEVPPTPAEELGSPWGAGASRRSGSASHIRKPRLAGVVPGAFMPGALHMTPTATHPGTNPPLEIGLPPDPTVGQLHGGLTALPGGGGRLVSLGTAKNELEERRRLANFRRAHRPTSRVVSGMLSAHGSVSRGPGGAFASLPGDAEAAAPPNSPSMRATAFGAYNGRSRDSMGQSHGASRDRFASTHRFAGDIMVEASTTAQKCRRVVTDVEGVLEESLRMQPQEPFGAAGGTDRAVAPPNTAIPAEAPVGAAEPEVLTFPLPLPQEAAGAAPAADAPTSSPSCGSAPSPQPRRRRKPWEDD